MNQVSIALEMLLLLKSRKIIKKEELAQELEISTKMVQRLRNQLEMAGYDIKTIPGQYGGYQLENSSFLPVKDLSQTDLDALSNAFSFIDQSNNPLFNKSFKEAFRKIIANHNKSNETTSTQTKSLAIDPLYLEELISKLQVAINNQYISILDYSNQKQYQFEPYQIFQVDIAWYVIGYHRYNDIRIFRLDRITNLDITNKQFIKEDDFNLNTYINNQGFKVEKPFIVSGIIANRNYLKELVTSDHQIYNDIDASTFEFQLRFYSKKRAQSFVLELGSDITIHKPNWLKEFQLNEALKILER